MEEFHVVQTVVTRKLKAPNYLVSSLDLDAIGLYLNILIKIICKDKF